VICPICLIRHHRVTRESAVGGSPQDRIPLLPGQAFQQPYPERISSQRSHAHAKGSIRASARVWRPLLRNAALCGSSSYLRQELTRQCSSVVDVT